ncbi:spindle assembly checkpoint kinase [Oryzias melastigma]|uniref:Spindle assembly checkpoint kinase-like n=1 Tax=Oryzias melastigma TaxID=30732 RepID=A0A3B3CRN9_ORYME|nr:spindle assembly checkpoint kinase [Oryzias melastigma]XP_024123468.1 spindle assembly checkpoint kinase [Oryzias melastigma]
MAYPTGTIAKGGFGKVYRENYNGTWAAIKKVPHYLITKKDLERECEVYNKSSHPNIVRLLGDITLTDGKWIIPLEFIHGEDLETTIFKAAKSKLLLTPTTKAIIIVGMCEGLLHLHSKDIVHQDLKPENIMVEHGTNRAVIIDLGLAKFFRYGLSSAVDMGNEAYSPPEVLQRRSPRNQLSDVWAMGKIIAEFLARVRLYTPTVCPAKIREVLGTQAYCSPVCRMVEQNPSRRSTMAGVIEELRQAGGLGRITYPNPPKDNLSVPGNNAADRRQSPGRIGRSPSPQNRNLRPMNRGLSPFRGEPSPFRRDLSPSPFHRHRSPSPFLRHRSPSPFHQNRFDH